MPRPVDRTAYPPSLEAILPTVERPSRYIGGEWNQVVKDRRSVDLSFALAFPDVYEIGMSHLGFRILYALLNQRSDTAAERVFCPWPDMADSMRRQCCPLTSLETQTPLGEFDVVGFSLQFEMTFTNVLEMLDLAGIPLRAAQRGEEDPLVVVGGPVVFNVEPLADFVDLVFVGDGEEMIPEFLDLLREMKQRGVPRAERIRQAARIEGIYAPALYAVERDERSGLLVPLDRGEAPFPVRRRILYDLDRFPFPDRIIVPHGEIVHDRVSVEIMRGCPVGCRFCQAGYIYRPTRERDPNQIRDAVVRSVRATGYDQFSLSSLNTGEYGAIHPVMVDLMDRFEPENVSISLSSMHASTITPELAREVRRVRKSGFTIAPEAGTQRLRDVINKNLSEEQILTACRLAFEAGWDQIKLYFMIGLPTETPADVDGLVDLAHAILDMGRRGSRRGRRDVGLTLSASSFIPKPETPFQWLGMDRLSELRHKQARISARVRRGVRFIRHDGQMSFIEGVFSRGDRALGNVLERAWRAGARFDSWQEHFRLDRWVGALQAEGLDAERYAHQDLDPAGRLPWDVVDSRVNRKWLALELRRAMQQGTLSVCGPKDCHGCAPFARECVRGVVAATTDRPFDPALPVVASPDHACPPLARRPISTAKLAPAALPGPQDRTSRVRYRGHFVKQGLLRFLGHRDLCRLLLRALRRAGVRLVYSQGFNPKPRVGFSPALAVGMASEAEYMDFEALDLADVAALSSRLNAALPAGVRFERLAVIPTESRALEDLICAAAYRVEVRGDVDLAPAEERLQVARARPLERVTKTRRQQFDLDAELLDFRVESSERMRLTLVCRSDAASLRPEDLLSALFSQVELARLEVTREQLLAAGERGLVTPLGEAIGSRHGERTAV